LNGLKIVLVFGFGQPVYIYLLRCSYLHQALLEISQVVHKFILEFSLPIDFGHGNGLPVVGVYQLAVDRAGAKILEID
jgi:hypothetical protein